MKIVIFQRLEAFPRYNSAGNAGFRALLLFISNVWYIKNDTKIQQSEDHVLPSFSGSKPPLLQYLGIPETEMLLEPAIFENELQQKDMYLVCSDGLTDMLTEDGILNILIKELSIRDKATELLSASLASGGRDNITFILIRLR